MAVAIADKATRSSDVRLFLGEGCSLDWLLNKVQGAPIETPKYFYEFGNIVHEMIEATLNGVAGQGVYEIREDYFAESQAYILDWIETKNGRKADLWENIATVYQKWVQHYAEHSEDWEIVQIEQTLEVATPDRTAITSTPDAVFVDPEGYYHVVDWKVGTSKSGKDLQLYIYWYLLRKAGIVPDDAYFRGHFHYVTYANPIGFTATSRYPGDDFIEAYINASERIRTQGPYLPNPSWFSCAYCAHKEDCPIFSDEPELAWEYIQNINVIFV